MAPWTTRIKHAWNAFTGTDNENPLRANTGYYGRSTATRPDRPFSRMPNERSIITSIYTRIAIDVASVTIRHIRTDDEGRYLEEIDSGLNNCLKIQANKDQESTFFIRDVVQTLLEEGIMALTPIDTSLAPSGNGSVDILSMRVGRIVDWMPDHIRVEAYNDKLGIKQELVATKANTAVVENPFYKTMNEPNSTVQRLIQKLTLLDAIDNQSASGKLDIIMQLPYAVKSDVQREKVEQRRKDIEFQLKDSKYGIAYADASEKITQLNRPIENNLLTQVEYLTKMLYGQLGVTEEVMNGTANEEAMINYFNRTIEPILTALVEAMRAKFLTKTARSQKQTVVFLRDPFRLVPLAQMAELADKFTRNEIVSSNEFRQAIGMKPSKDPKADQLVNSNMPQADTGATPAATGADPDVMGAAFDEIDAELDKALEEFGVDPEAEDEAS